MKISLMNAAACVIMFFLVVSTACSINQNTSPKELWKFAVLCDTRGDDQNSSYKSCINDTLVKALATAVVNDGCDLVLVPGDMINGWWSNCCINNSSQCCIKDMNKCSAKCKIPYNTQFNNWKAAMEPLNKTGIEIYAVRGNHEDGPSPYPPRCPYSTTPDADLKKAFIEAFGSKNTSNGPCGEENLTYSFSHKNAFFIGFDDYITPHRVNQNWLYQQLASNNKTHVFVFGHEPAFQVGHPDCLGAYPWERNSFLESITSAGCRVYFCGHDHLYNRAHVLDSSGNKIYQMVVGSCGAPFKQWSPPYNDTFVVGDYHNEKDCGYVLVTIDGANATVEWKALQKDTWVTLDSFKIESDVGTPDKIKDAKVTLTYEGSLPVEMRGILNIFPAKVS
jgi:hypothetical protein